MHVTGITAALSAAAPRSVTEAVARTHEIGATVSVDINHRARLWPKAEAREVLLPLACLLDDVDLLAEQERQVVRRHAAVLAGIEKEPITKSYKLVTLQALLQMDALRTGADVAEIGWTAHRIVTGDPRACRRPCCLGPGP